MEPERRSGEQPIHPVYEESTDPIYSLDSLVLALDARRRAHDLDPGSPDWWHEQVGSINAGHAGILSAIHEQTYVLKEAVDALREAIERLSERPSADGH